jgi:O-antigen/teichoic acid export membrane protein
MDAEPPAAGPPPLRTYFVRGAGGTLVLQGVSTAFLVLTSFLLARVLGAGGLGTYVYALTWVRLLSIPALMGLDRLLLRQIAVYSAREEWGHLAGLLRWAGRAVALLAVAISLAAAIVAWLVDGCVVTKAVVVFWVCLPFLLAEALVTLRASMLRGFRRIVQSGLPGFFLKPLLFTVLLCTVLLLPGTRLSPAVAAALQVAAGFGSLVFAEAMFRKAVPEEVRNAKPVLRGRAWAKGAVPFLFQAGLASLSANLEILLLGSLAGKDEAGIYAVALRAAGLLAFFLVAANAPLAPLVAHFKETGEFARLQRFLTKIARTLFLVVLPFALLLIVLREPALGLFGDEFTAGSTALVLLCAAQLANVGVGSVGLILNMTGHEKVVLGFHSLSVTLKLLLGAILIPRYGVTGAAISGATGLFLWNVLLVWQVHRRLGLHSTALGRLGGKRA